MKHFYSKVLTLTSCCSLSLNSAAIGFLLLFISFFCGRYRLNFAICRYIVYPFACLSITTRPGVCAKTVPFAIDPHAIVSSATIPDHSTSTIAFAIFKLTNILAATSLLNSISFPLAIHVLTFVIVPGSIYDAAKTMTQPRFLNALKERAIV